MSTRYTKFVVAGVVAVALAGCGILQPTPARFRPRLPEARAMPRLTVEGVTSELGLLDYDCSFDPGGDIPASWSCVESGLEPGDSTSVGLTAAAAGPIERVTVYKQIVLGPDTGPDAAILDQEAAAAFRPVLNTIVPSEDRPTDEELMSGVRRNYPIELDGDWFIGFDRNAISRTMYLVFAGEG